MFSNWLGWHVVDVKVQAGVGFGKAVLEKTSCPIFWSGWMVIDRSERLWIIAMISPRQLASLVPRWVMMCFDVRLLHGWRLQSESDGNSMAMPVGICASCRGQIVVLMEETS